MLTTELLASEIPILKAGTKRVPIYRLLCTIPSRKLLIAQFEVTTSHKYNVMVGWYLQRDGEKLTHPVTENITPAQHHLSRNVTFVDEVPFPGDRTYELVLYAAASKAESRHKLKVENYGFLQVVSL